jgi:hypothetical protein
MRIWSIHPKYLDAKGLVALWRETLLAKHVLEGKTKGYTYHPQLTRFKKCASPPKAVNFYLSEILKEANTRNYHFDDKKIDWNFTPIQLTVTNRQVEYEMQHLLRKLWLRDRRKYTKIKGLQAFEAHPIFVVVKGDIEDWEIR